MKDDFFCRKQQITKKNDFSWVFTERSQMFMHNQIMGYIVISYSILAIQYLDAN